GGRPPCRWPPRPAPARRVDHQLVLLTLLSCGVWGAYTQIASRSGARVGWLSRPFVRSHAARLHLRCRLRPPPSAPGAGEDPDALAERWRRTLGRRWPGPAISRRSAATCWPRVVGRRSGGYDPEPDCPEAAAAGAAGAVDVGAPPSPRRAPGRPRSAGRSPRRPRAAA